MRRTRGTTRTPIILRSRRCRTRTRPSTHSQTTLGTSVSFPSLIAFTRCRTLTLSVMLVPNNPSVMLALNHSSMTLVPNNPSVMLALNHSSMTLALNNPSATLILIHSLVMLALSNPSITPTPNHPSTPSALASHARSPRPPRSPRARPSSLS